MKLKFLLVILLLSSIRILHSQTVVDIIVNSPNHNTLEAAVLAAGLEGALSGDGPFTVFAPTDDAFAALPPGTIEALLNDIPTLTSILTYHVVGANALSTELSDGQIIKTLNGKNITVTINNDGVFINNAKVTVADLIADNGVVHVIDAVLLPPTISVVDIITGSPVHNTLEAAVLAAGLEGALSGDGPFTVFAPTDDAFAALPPGTIEALLNDIPTLTSILTYHVVGANALSTDLSDGQIIKTLNGKNITVTINNDGVFINNAKVTVADLIADNGVVQVIDAVLLPPTSSFDVNSKLDLSIAPNPASNFLKLNINDGSLVEILEIANAQGQPVQRLTNVSLNNQIDISQLPSGIYLLKVENQNGIAVKKFVKK
ncbi:MAG: fasciclin domain-containing protein [Saprospiraceae bacterium]|nr:fasciclin domain-containing protein [Saprospiraceae bacterium]